MITTVTETTTPAKRKPATGPSVPPWLAIAVLGVAMALGGLAWWFFTRPSDADIYNAQLLGDPIPHAAVAGPIVLAIAGAVLAIIGAIVWSGRARRDS
jgi:H+/gluconate symporter-like permease